VTRGRFAAWLGAAVLGAHLGALQASADGAPEAEGTPADTEPASPEASPLVAPGVVHYQGRFSQPNGDPLAGPVTLTFTLYAAASGGTPLWAETHTDVPLVDGVGSVLLGSIVSFPATAFSAPNRYLEIQVGDETLAPRLQVAAAPFAIEADRLDGKEATDFEPAGSVQGLANSLKTSDGTPPNQGGNRVHWDQLTGVPQGFADGSDDGGGVTDHGQLTGLEDDDHPQYLLREDAGTSDGDPPNQGSNLVSWDNLVGVPEDFADGVDDGFSGGGITGAQVADSTLTAADIQPRSLTGATLAAKTVTGAEIANETISGNHIIDDSIRSADILDNGITSVDIADGTVSNVDLANNAVTGAKIADGSIGIADVNFPVGDLTGLAAGPGLSGGGTAGDVSLQVVAGSGIAVGSSVSLSPSYVSGSAYDGRFVSRSAPAWSAVTAAVSVAGATFNPATPTGKYTRVTGVGSIYVDDVANAGAEDEFFAPIQLPHGAQITGFWATYWDNSAGSLDIELWRSRQNGATTTLIAAITTTGQTASWQTGSDLIITETVVDNVEFTYWLEADFPSTPQGQNLRLRSVRVSYTVTGPH